MVDLHMVKKDRESKMDRKNIDWDVSHETKPNEKV